jgi:hypothetical protein
MKPRNVLPSLLLLLFPLVATAAERPEPAGKSLSPEKIQQIQAISQAVLTAKRSEPANPDLETLRQEVEELRKAVVKFHGQVVQPAAPITLRNETVTSEAGQDGRKVRAKAESDVRDTLNKVRQHRTALQKKIDEAAAGEDRSRERNAAAKVRELEDELDLTLQGKPEEQAEKLRSLAERLAVKHRPVTEECREKTPTISTIVQHRQ